MQARIDRSIEDLEHSFILGVFDTVTLTLTLSRFYARYSTMRRTIRCDAEVEVVVVTCSVHERANQRRSLVSYCLLLLVLRGGRRPSVRHIHGLVAFENRSKLANLGEHLLGVIHLAPLDDAVDQALS